MWSRNGSLVTPLSMSLVANGEKGSQKRRGGGHSHGMLRKSFIISFLSYDDIVHF